MPDSACVAGVSSRLRPWQARVASWNSLWLQVATCTQICPVPAPQALAGINHAHMRAEMEVGWLLDRWSELQRPEPFAASGPE